MSEKAALCIYIVLAVLNFAFQDWPLFEVFLLPLWRAIRWAGISAWRWTATWKWDGIFSIGWGLMLASGEYSISLVCLGLATIGALSGVDHWAREKRKSFYVRALTSIAVLGTAGLLTLVTLSNKGDKPGSGIPNYLASRMPLPSDPSFRHFNIPLPENVAIERTSQSSWEHLLHKQQDAPVVPMKAPSVPIQVDASVAVWAAIGDDNLNAVFITSYLKPSNNPSMICRAPFICYSEEQLKTTRIEMDFNNKKRRRLFFAVENTSTALIANPTVTIVLNQDPSAADPMTEVKGVTLSRIDGGLSSSTVGAVWSPKETVDIVPFFRSNNSVDYVVDLTLTDTPPENLVVIFRIFAANLTTHNVPVFLHIQQSIGVK